MVPHTDRSPEPTRPAPAASGLKASLIVRARAEGFDAVRVTGPDAIPAAPERLRSFLDSGFQGSMAWMAERAEQRGDPRILWPDVRSIVMLGLNYGPGSDPRLGLEDRAGGLISAYAQGDDYHDVVKKKLKSLGRWLGETTGQALKVFVDTAPVMEKPLAAAAGLGWQGKHTNLVSREFGSWLFLGAIFSAAAIEPDGPERDHCGSCRACLDACPTAAFPAPYRLDARRCISYLTIENKGPIPRRFRAAIGNRIYGCDDCLAACPWNKFAQTAREQRLAARAELRQPRLLDLARLDDAGFRALFARNPVKRIGRDRFMRNVLVALGNGGDGAAVPAVERLLRDPSPLVRGAAIWALSRLAPERLAAASALAVDETDGEVRTEWCEAGIDFQGNAANLSHSDGLP
ncbi:tRNA epoxyqueuosine(34) reductase QueG [Labrys monachus]|uniref:Epoxyqueuosine reductase n=1 Tax=Labrys monachus TaxID=217067 RepID=A0ABU0FCI5_9HYPH|nr:tRNA epoxyqueuosine(34) reductase QueG [Labrys monachus]MDQ0392317.1 epoxyqueuosine reductase [Labrys monachus]